MQRCQFRVLGLLVLIQRISCIEGHQSTAGHVPLYHQVLVFGRSTGFMGWMASELVGCPWGWIGRMWFICPQGWIKCIKKIWDSQAAEGPCILRPMHMEQVSWQYAIIHLKHSSWHSSSYLAHGGTAHGSPKMRQRGLSFLIITVTACVASASEGFGVRFLRVKLCATASSAEDREPASCQPWGPQLRGMITWNPRERKTEESESMFQNYKCR